MSTVLFIKANDRPANQAVSIMIYDAFLQSYRDTNPGDHVLELDLYSETLPYMNAAMIGGMFKAMQGLELIEKEKSAVAIADKYRSVSSGGESCIRIPTMEFNRASRASYLLRLFELCW
jgi:FMN-dependent NADH-azoreductase